MTDPPRTGRAIARVLAALLLTGSTPLFAAPTTDASLARLDRVLKSVPLIDGHNDWPMALRMNAKDDRWTVPLETLDPQAYDTDIARLRKGRVGGQFWSVYVSANLPEQEQVERTLEQIDLVRQLPRRYPDTFAIVRTADEVRAAYRAGRIASLIGVEGGGQIDNSFSVLRAYHALGAGYLTLTHSKTIAWADSATDAPRHDGLTPFGVEVVRELNRLGMLVDLSHVSEATMRDAIAASRAPVIFSHSSARALCDHTRNAPDDVLKLTAANGGIVMINFAPQFISEERRLWGGAQAAEAARLKTLFTGEPAKEKAAMDAWMAANPEPVVTIAMVADHVDHVAKVAGFDHVGLGGDYDGLPRLPEGLEGVDGYPALMMELMRRGWSDANLASLAGGNILRVMQDAERVARAMAREAPAVMTVPKPGAP